MKYTWTRRESSISPVDVSQICALASGRSTICVAVAFVEPVDSKVMMQYMGHGFFNDQSLKSPVVAIQIFTLV